MTRAEFEVLMDIQDWPQPQRDHLWSRLSPVAASGDLCCETDQQDGIINVPFPAPMAEVLRRAVVC